MAEEVVLRFEDVCFEYVHKSPILDEASFSMRRGSKFTLMGQNGAGKSTLFGLIKGDLEPRSGKISVDSEATVATQPQVVAQEDKTLTIEQYFEKAFELVPGNIKSQIAKVMDAVNFTVPTDRIVGDLSGGQQARLLLAYALIQEPDILLLDEPTNNLDQEGINHLISFLVMYEKTVLVISHDANFLNLFTDGILYLDVYTKKVESYVGDYFSAVEQIEQQREREKKANAQLAKQIQDNKDKVNFFAMKGGKMRKLAKKLKDEIEELEDNKVEIRKDDRTIRPFKIPNQDIYGDIVTINSVKVIIDHEPVEKEVNKVLTKKSRLLITGPNGIGKSTLLRSLVDGEHPGVKIMDGVVVGYYSQDFGTLKYDQTVFESLKEASIHDNREETIRSVASGFLITNKIMENTVGSLSEGQKGLLSFARLTLLQPGLLILDEPTNHINFRHIPVIAEAINNYEGTMMLISHMQEFVDDVHVDDYLDLGKL